jgi:hypothetical protein
MAQPIVTHSGTRYGTGHSLIEEEDHEASIAGCCIESFRLHSFWSYPGRVQARSTRAQSVSCWVLPPGSEGDTQAARRGETTAGCKRRVLRLHTGKVQQRTVRQTDYIDRLKKGELRRMALSNKRTRVPRQARYPPNAAPGMTFFFINIVVRLPSGSAYHLDGGSQNLSTCMGRSRTTACNPDRHSQSHQKRLVVFPHFKLESRNVRCHGRFPDAHAVCQKFGTSVLFTQFNLWGNGNFFVNTHFLPLATVLQKHFFLEC